MQQRFQPHHHQQQQQHQHQSFSSIPNHNNNSITTNMTAVTTISPSTISDQYTRFIQSCRKANEVFSQAESTCSQFSLQTKKFGQQSYLGSMRGGGNKTNTNNDNTSNNDPEVLNNKFEQLIQNCQDACSDIHQLPLWNSNNISFEALQALSPIQRQRLESQRNEIQDLTERQIKVLTNRHGMNVQKWRTSSSSSMMNNNNMNNSQPDHVSRVLSSSSSSSDQKFYSGPNFNPDTATEEEYKKKERESIHRVSSGVRQMVSESNAVLGALRQQRARMQETDTRLGGGVLSGAGVAQSVVRQLEKMTTVDKAIVFGGIGFLTVFMIFLWFFM